MHVIIYYMLSHTWVRYQGFLGHEIKCLILTTVVPGFFGDLIGCTIRSKWGPFGNLYLARKNISCVWKKLFLVEIKLSQRRTRPVKYLLSGWKYTNGYPNKVWDKSKTTWAVGIVHLNSQLGPRSGAKILRLRSRDFCPHLEPRGELIAQYRPPMSFRYNPACVIHIQASLSCIVTWK